MLTRWWEASEMYGFSWNYLPRDTAYMAEVDGIPGAVISVYKTNIKEYAYLECYVSNPEMKKAHRRAATEAVMKHAENQAHSMGYNKLVCLTHVDGLKPRLEELGFLRSLNNVTTFVKEL